MVRHQQLAYFLRGVALSLKQDCPAGREQMQALQKWISFLQVSADQFLPALEMVSSKPIARIRQVFLCDALRSDANLRPVLEFAAHRVLPASSAAELISSLQHRSFMGNGVFVQVNVPSGRSHDAVVEVGQSSSPV